MTRTEVLSIMTIMKAAFPNFYKDMESSEVKAIISLWTEMFASDSAKVVVEAVKSLMCTLKFPPTIADVKEKITLITQPETVTEMEAWNVVLAAIKNSNYGSQASFDNFPPIIKKLVGSPNQLREWAMMEVEDVGTIIQSNFMRSYKAKAQSEKEYNLLPESTKNLIETAKIKMLEADHEHD